MRKTAKFSSFPFLRPLVVALALAPAGCGNGKGDISGTVRVNGAPVSSGRVTFTSEKQNGTSVIGAIGTDGRYKVAGCPPGPVKITVSPVFSRGAPREGPEAKDVIPLRYAKGETSDLTYTVRAGRQQHDIELKE
jgi:hypothetical protein